MTLFYNRVTVHKFIVKLLLYVFILQTPGNSQIGGEEQESPGPASPSIYSMVGLPQPQPVNHQPLPVDLPMATMTSMPESLYAVVGEKTSQQ
jgi:hypothetical protein